MALLWEELVAQWLPEKVKVLRQMKTAIKATVHFPIGSHDRIGASNFQTMPCDRALGGANWMYFSYPKGPSTSKFSLLLFYSRRCCYAK